MTKNNIKLSRLFLYAVARIIEDTPVNNDSGMYISDGCNVVKKYGVCKESVYPYIQSNFSLFPPLNVFKSSNLFKSFSYTSVNQDLTSLKQCLYVNKVPIIFGLIVYDSFMSQSVANTGIVPMPNTHNENVQGGHCMLIVGYDDTKQWFVCANSWGTAWGNNGYCYLHYAYMTNTSLTSDFCYLTFTY
jgi:C1A family cysteine protease